LNLAKVLAKLELEDQAIKFYKFKTLISIDKYRKNNEEKSKTIKEYIKKNNLKLISLP